MRECRLSWTKDWRKRSQKLFTCLSETNFNLWIHSKTLWYRPLCWNCHILVDRWNSTTTLAKYSLTAPKTACKHNKTNRVLVTIAHRHKRSIRNHAERFPGNLLIRLSSRTIPRSSQFLNPYYPDVIERTPILADSTGRLASWGLHLSEFDFDFIKQA